MSRGSTDRDDEVDSPLELILVSQVNYIQYKYVMI